MSLSRISVGIDRSKGAADALRWSCALAEATGASIFAVGSWQMPLFTFTPEPIDGMPNVEVFRSQCESTVRAVVETVTGEATSKINVEQVVVEGPPGPSMVAESATSDLLVVGRTGRGHRRGLSRVAELVLGSTARHCIHHAQTPVATVPQGSRWPDRATVAVGVDGSESSLAALRWAMTSLPASTEVHVVRAYEPWTGNGLTPHDAVGDRAVEKAVQLETQRWVRESLEGVASSPSIPVRIDVRIGNARSVLVNPGYSIDLLIVGESGLTGVAAKVLGSVADHVVRHAACPTIVVPDERIGN